MTDKKIVPIPTRFHTIPAVLSETGFNEKRFEEVVKPIFFKYFLKSYPFYAAKCFDDDGLNEMRHGRNPFGWKLFLQTPIKIGGVCIARNAFLDVHNIFLTPEYVQFLQNENKTKNKNDIALCIYREKLELFLQEQESKGPLILIKTFNQMFEHFLILAPNSIANEMAYMVDKQLKQIKKEQKMGLDQAYKILVPDFKAVFYHPDFLSERPKYKTEKQQEIIPIKDIRKVRWLRHKAFQYDNQMLQKEWQPFIPAHIVQKLRT